jgi:hypothetical protein
VTVETDQKVDGPLYGGGATVVFGGNKWFAMAEVGSNFDDARMLILSGNIRF